MFSSPAFAQAAGAGAPGGSIAAIMQSPLPMMLFIVVIFYFLVIRPQQKKMKEHRALIDAVKKGDAVVTAGGVIGKVTKVEDNEVEVEVSPNVRIKVVKSTLSDVRSAGAAKPAND
jgi:preprotein translocase subunit YajC